MNNDLDNKTPSCYAPWINTYEWTDGTITPCCEWNPNSPTAIKTKSHMSFEERFNHPKMKAIKEDLLTKPINKVPGCINCVKNEEVNLWSHRDSLNALIKEDYTFDQDTFKLLHMDYRESNLCNFSCKMCGQSLSSTHAIIVNQTKMYDNESYPKDGILKNHHKLQEYLDNLDDVKLVGFLGGEPTLMNSMYIIIKEIKRRKLESNMEVSLVTNGSVIHKDQENLLEHLSGFRHVTISISMDVAGDEHNYWRHKNTWDNVWKNTKTLHKFAQENSNTFMQIRTALSWPTSFAARKVFELFKNLPVKHLTNLVVSPAGLNINQLPKHLLDDLVVWWQDYPEIASIFKNTKSLTRPRILTQEKERLEQFDKYHGNSFVDTFPEFKDFYNNIG